MKLNEASVTLDYSEKVLAVGEEFKFNASVSNGKSVSWKSRDTDIANVDGQGYVTALKVGETEITASCGLKSAKCRLIVVPTVIEMKTGFVIFPSDDAAPDFELSGSEDRNNIYVYFDCTDGSVSDFSIYITPLDVFNAKIPRAHYRIYIAEGQNWYGTEYRFGDGTDYEQSDKIYDLTEGSCEGFFAIWFSGDHEDAVSFDTHDIPEDEFPDV